MPKEASTPWSNWKWSESRGCEAHYRVNLKGVEVWEYRKPQDDYSQAGAQLPDDAVDDLSYGLRAANLDPYQESERGKGKAPATTNNSAAGQYNNNYPEQTIPSKSSSSGGRSRHYQNPAGKAKLEKQLKLHRSKEFKRFRIFKCVWSEPQGVNGTGNTQGSQITEKFVDGGTFRKVRPFLIIKEEKGHSLCLPIMTYGYQATLKRGVHAAHHAMIYSSSSQPKPLLHEQLTKKAIKIDITDFRYPLDDASRLNYNKLYTVEHNVKVHFIGTVAKRSQHHVVTDYNVTHQPLAYPPFPGPESSGEDPTRYIGGHEEEGTYTIDEGDEYTTRSQELPAHSDPAGTTPRVNPDPYYEAEWAADDTGHGAYDRGEESSHQQYDPIDAQTEWAHGNTGYGVYEAGEGSSRHHYDYDT